MVIRQRLYRSTNAPLQKGSLVHIGPAYVESEKGSNHFGSYLHNLFLYFYERLFPRLNSCYVFKASCKLQGTEKVWTSISPSSCPVWHPPWGPWRR
jgi:hypothetical protein